MRVLGIETSCDETAVCLIEANGNPPAGGGGNFSFKILGNALYSQVETHRPYGGVFPNLARREHEHNLVPLLTSALKEAAALREKDSPISAGWQNALKREPELLKQLETFLETYKKPEIDAIAVTTGPGLEPALWVGINFARALSIAWDIKIVSVNHMEGHIVMSLVENEKMAIFSFPAVALLVSGGHTELVLVKNPPAGGLEYELIGQTRDDAVGEAFDKAARILGLPYPGGPEISRLAEIARQGNVASDTALPRPMINSNDFDFSFSGLKTATLRLVQKNMPLSNDMKIAIAREFEDAAVDVLISKTLRALETYGAQTLIVGGGVSANKHLRSRIAKATSINGTNLLICPPAFSGDNALMIALAGYFHALKGNFANPETIAANGNLRLAP